MTPKCLVMMTPYEVQLAIEGQRVVVLSPDEAQKLVVSLIAAIRTITLPIRESHVVH